MSVPRLSVVMPVFNALPYLDEAIASILDQSFVDFEFVILNDGSVDGSAERLRDWAGRDRRIRLAGNGRRLGPVGSSQAAVEASRAPLVARMDADDVAHPERLARQMDVFESEPDAVLVGTLHCLIDARGKQIRPAQRALLAKASPFPRLPHGSILFRRDAFDAARGYRVGTDYWEDIDLLDRMAKQGRVLIVADALYRARYSSAGGRFNADPAVLDRAYGTMARRTEAKAADGAKIPVQAFVLSGSPRLWAGERPRVLGRLLRRGALAPDRQTFGVVGWALWAELHPRSLRWALNWLSRRRERRIPHALRSARWVEWRPWGSEARR